MRGTRSTGRTFARRAAVVIAAATALVLVRSLGSAFTEGYRNGRTQGARCGTPPYR